MRQLDGSTTFSNFDSPGNIPDGHTFFTAPLRVLFYLGGTITHPILEIGPALEYATFELTPTKECRCLA